MGGTTSKNTVESINSLAVHMMVPTIQTCATSATQSQIIQFKNVSGNLDIRNISFEQGVTIDMDCLMESRKFNHIAGSIGEAIAQQAESMGQAGLSALGNTRADVISKVINKVQHNVNGSTKNQIIGIINQTQSMVITNITGNVILKNLSMEQSAHLIAYALMKSSTVSDVVNEFSREIDQLAKSEEKNVLASIFDGIAKIALVGFIAFAILFFIFLKYGPLGFVKAIGTSFGKLFSSIFGRGKVEKKRRLEM